MGQHARILHLDEAYACAIEAHYQQLRDEGQTRLEYPLVDATGAMRWFDMQALLRQPGDPESDVVWTMTDVTDRHQAVQALQAQHLRMVTLLEQFQAAVLLEEPPPQAARAAPTVTTPEASRKLRREIFFIRVNLLHGFPIKKFILKNSAPGVVGLC